MIKHTHTESVQVNFSKLEERIMAINNPEIGKFNQIRNMLYELTIENKPVLIVATGGSKVVAYYLQLIMEQLSKVICEVVEPRDYFYKTNIECFSSLVVISASGNTNGVGEILTRFQGKKYLVCEQEKKADYEVIFWGNERYQKEKSFISLATSLGPAALLLDATALLHSELSSDEVRKINDKIKELFIRSKSKIEQLEVNFKDVSCIQIMSG